MELQKRCRCKVEVKMQGGGADAWWRCRCRVEVQMQGGGGGRCKVQVQM